MTRWLSFVVPSAICGAVIGAVATVVIISVAGTLTGLRFVIEHADEGVLTLLASGAAMFAMMIGIPASPIGAVIGLLIGAIVGARATANETRKPPPLPE